MRRLAELRAVGAALAAPEPRRSRGLLSEAGGGRGDAMVVMVVTGYTEGGRRFLARSIDADGEPTGEEVEVHAITQPAAAGGAQGTEDLERCYPLIEPGQWILCRRGRWKLAGQIVEGLICVWAFQPFCEASP
ncbi:MAG: hypothetical protein LC135_01790 [Phycisphaerae bacterium]|nr:hypothetical protein [Phycisphaerae bacterium]MCZ2398585.1 hypothetical protein [Phycisphaerae bacterium]